MSLAKKIIISKNTIKAKSNEEEEIRFFSFRNVFSVEIH
jgi:hypothetical protein